MTENEFRALLEERLQKALAKFAGKTITQDMISEMSRVICSEAKALTAELSEREAVPERALNLAGLAQ